MALTPPLLGVRWFKIELSLSVAMIATMFSYLDGRKRMFRGQQPELMSCGVNFWTSAFGAS